MSILLYLIPIALSLGAVGLLAFFWACRTGQFEDLEGASWRALEEDEGVSSFSSDADREKV